MAYIEKGLINQFVTLVTVSPIFSFTAFLLMLNLFLTSFVLQLYIYRIVMLAKVVKPKLLTIFCNIK